MKTRRERARFVIVINVLLKMGGGVFPTNPSWPQLTENKTAANKQE